MAEFLHDLNIHGAGQIQFKTTAGANAGKIDQNGNNLVITNAVGDVLLGDGSSDVYIGDGTNNVDIIFEQSGAIKGDGSAITLTLGGANTTLNLENPNFNGNIGMSSKLTFTTANGYILFDYEPSTGSNAEYSSEVPLLKVDHNGTEKTILSRLTNNAALAIGNDDTVAIVAGDTKSVIKDNHDYAAENVILSSEGGFIAYAFPDNTVTWANRNVFEFRGYSNTAANNGLYIGDGGQTQFIDLSRNLKNIGTISSTGDVTITNGNIIFSSQYGVRFNDANTRIYTNTDTPEDLLIEADQDILLTPDGQVNVHSHLVLSDNSYVVSARKFTARDSNGVMLTADDGSSGLSIADNGNATFTGNLDFSNNKGLTWAGSHSVRVEGNILKLNASSGIQAQNPVEIAISTSTSGTTGTTFLELDNNVGGDISQQQTFIDFKFTDTNANFTPQVRIGAQVGPDADANAISKEGAGSFVVYTAPIGSDESGNSSGLAESMRVSYDGSVTFDSGKVIIDNISNNGRIHGTSSLFLGGVSTSLVQLSANLIPDADSSRDLGTTTRYWRDAYIDAITTTGNITAGGNIILGDGQYIHLGDNPDLKIYHNGSHSFIQDTGAGDLRLLGSSIKLQSTTEENMLVATPDGTVALYHDNSVRFETGAAGAQVTGNFYLFSGNYIHFDNGVTNDYAIRKISTTLQFKTGGTYDFQSGNAIFAGDIMPSADSTYDIGSNANKWAEGHFDHIYIGETGNYPRIDIYTEDSTTNIADSFADTTTDKSYIYFQAGSGSSDPGYIMHETSDSETNEAVLHLVPSDDNSTGDYVSIHGTNDPDVLKLHTSGLIETVNLQLQLKSGLNAVYINDELTTTGHITTTADGTYNIGSDGSRFATGYFDAVGVTNTLTAGGLDINGNGDISGNLNITGNITNANWQGDVISAAKGGTGLNSISTLLNANAFANFTSTSGDYDNFTRGLQRAQGGSNGPSGGSHSTGFTLLQDDGNYGFQLFSIGSGDNTEKLFYRYKGTSYENWQTIVTKTYADNRYGKIASPTFTGTVTVPDLTVTGNLSITGDINSYNVTDLDVSDKTITVGVGQAENVSGGSGLKVSGPSTQPSMLWDESNDTWDFNYGIDVAGNITVSGTVDGVDVANHNHDNRYYTETESDAKFTSTDASGDNYTFELEDESNFSGNKWYHVATIDSANGGLHIRGAMLNHVENFASQKIDIAIQVREENDGGQLEITGSLDVLHNATSGTDKCGIRVIKSSEDGTYDEFKVYVRVTRYQMVTLRLTQQGSVVFNTNHSSPLTSEPAAVSGGHVELDTSSTPEGNYVIDNSTIKEIYHEGHKPTYAELGTMAYSNLTDTPTIPSGNQIIDWTTSQTANIHADNYTNTTYSVGDGGLTQNNLTDTLKSNYDTAYTHSQAAHAPSDADATPSWVPSSDPGYLTSSSTQSKYLRSDTADTATGKITLEGNSANWDTSTPGTTTGSLHFDPGVTTDNFGNAITFGASDSSNGTTAQAGIYLRTDGNYGSRMYFATTDDYSQGSKVAMYINQNKLVYFLGGINMSNTNISGVNAIQFADPGPSEGVTWTNTKIFESPNDLTTNTSGNLQLVYNNTRRLTVDSGGIDVNGNIVVSGTVDGVDISGLPTFSTVGTAFAQLGDVSVASYIRINADETLSYLNAAQFLSAIGGVDGSAYLPLTGGTLTGGLGVQGNTTLGDATSDTTTINGSTLLNKKAASGTDISILQLKTSDGSTTWNIGGNNTSYNDFMIWAPDLGAGNYFQINKTSGNATFGGDILVNTTTSGGYIQIDHSDDSLKLADANKIKLGTGNDLEIYHDGSNSYIKDGGTGDLRIWADNPNISTLSGNKIFYGNNGAAELYFTGGVKKLETTNTGVTVTGNLTATDSLIATNAVVIGTNGTPEQVSIFEGSTNEMWFQQGTAGGTVRYQTDNFIIQGYNGNETQFTSARNGAVELYYDNVKKFETTTDGIKINGSNTITTNSGRLQVNSAFKATGNIVDVNIPCLFNSNFQDGTGSGINVVPFNSLSEAAVSTATYYHFLTMPYAGELKKVVLKNVSGSLGSGFTTQLFFYVNGSQQASSAELSISNSAVTWTPTSNNTFSAGDEISFAYQKSAAGTGITWAGVSFGVAIELTDYDI